MEERGEAVPREDGYVLAGLGGVAAIDEPRAGGFAGREFRPPEVEALEGVGWDGLAGFGFDGVEDVAAFDDGVDFILKSAVKTKIFTAKAQRSQRER